MRREIDGWEVMLIGALILVLLALTTSGCTYITGPEECSKRSAEIEEVFVVGYALEDGSEVPGFHILGDHKVLRETYGADCRLLSWKTGFIGGTVVREETWRCEWCEGSAPLVIGR